VAGRSASRLTRSVAHCVTTRSVGTIKRCESRSRYVGKSVAARLAGGGDLADAPAGKPAATRVCVGPRFGIQPRSCGRGGAVRQPGRRSDDAVVQVTHSSTDPPHRYRRTAPASPTGIASLFSRSFPCSAWECMVGRSASRLTRSVAHCVTTRPRGGWERSNGASRDLGTSENL
jgi:hypothetical protein